MGDPSKDPVETALDLLQPHVDEHLRRSLRINESLVLDYAEGKVLQPADGYYKIKPEYSVLCGMQKLELALDPPPVLAPDQIRFTIMGANYPYSVKTVGGLLAKYVRDIPIDGGSMSGYETRYAPEVDWNELNQLLAMTSNQSTTYSLIERLKSELAQMGAAEEAVLQLVHLQEIGAENDYLHLAKKQELVQKRLEHIQELANEIRQTYRQARESKTLNTAHWTGTKDGWPVGKEQMAKLWRNPSSAQLRSREEWTREYLRLLYRTQYRPQDDGTRLLLIDAALRAMEGLKGKAELGGTLELAKDYLAYEALCAKLPLWMVGQQSAQERFGALNQFGQLRSKLSHRISRTLEALSAPDVYAASDWARLMLILLKQQVDWTRPEEETQLMRRARRMWKNRWPSQATSHYLQAAHQTHERTLSFSQALRPHAAPAAAGNGQRHKKNSLAPPSSDPSKAERARLNLLLREEIKDLREQGGVLALIYAAVMLTEDRNSQDHVCFKKGIFSPLIVDQIAVPERLGETLLWFVTNRYVEGDAQAIRSALKELGGANAKVRQTLRELVGDVRLEALLDPEDPRFRCVERTLLQHRTDRDWHKKRHSQDHVSVPFIVHEPDPQGEVQRPVGMEKPKRGPAGKPEVPTIIFYRETSRRPQSGEGRARAPLMAEMYGPLVDRIELAREAGAKGPTDYEGLWLYLLENRPWFEYVQNEVDTNPHYALADLASSPDAYSGFVHIEADGKVWNAQAPLIEPDRRERVQIEKRKDMAKDIAEMKKARNFKALERLMNYQHGSKYWIANQVLREVKKDLVQTGSGRALSNLK